MYGCGWRSTLGTRGYFFKAEDSVVKSIKKNRRNNKSPVSEENFVKKLNERMTKKLKTHSICRQFQSNSAVVQFHIRCLI